MSTPSLVAPNSRKQARLGANRTRPRKERGHEMKAKNNFLGIPQATRKSALTAVNGLRVRPKPRNNVSKMKAPMPSTAGVSLKHRNRRSRRRVCSSPTHVPCWITGAEIKEHRKAKPSLTVKVTRNTKRTAAASKIKGNKNTARQCGWRRQR
jgi:hypothetical protein